MDFLKITSEKLEIDKITKLVASEKCGAISSFMGTTRDNFEEKIVETLQYDCYESMALKTLEKLCREIRGKWTSVEHIAIYHRLGTVPVKETSIIIAISSPHRQDSLKATEYCIENVKKSVPIWKKEMYKDAPAQWKENCEFFAQKVDAPPIPSQLIQIKASNQVLNSRIEKFMKRKRQELNRNNIKEFCQSTGNCARIDSLMRKTKDSKGHLKVTRILNTFHRDQDSADYITKYNPENGFEERIQNLETQLNLTPSPSRKDIYLRLKNLEDGLLYLESISPEYNQFWDKNLHGSKCQKKQNFSLQDINSLISECTKNIKKIV